MGQAEAERAMNWALAYLVALAEKADARIRARNDGRGSWGLEAPSAKERLSARADEIVASGRDNAMQAARAKGARHKRGSRKCPRIHDWLLKQLELDPAATNVQLAEGFPRDELKLHRDDEGRFLDDGNGVLSKSGFDRYVTVARKELEIARRSSSRGS